MVRKLVIGAWLAALALVLFESYRIGPWKGQPKDSFWQNYQGPGSLFQVDLPDQPAFSIVDLSTYAAEFTAQRPRTAHWMSARGANRYDYFLAGYFEWSEFSFRSADGEATARAGFRVALKELEQRMGHKGIRVLGETDVEVGQEVAREYAIEAAGPGLIYPRKLKGRVRVLPRGLFLFFTIAVTPTNKGYDRAVQHYFDSFLLL